MVPTWANKNSWPPPTYMLRTCFSVINSSKEYRYWPGCTKNRSEGKFWKPLISVDLIDAGRTSVVWIFLLGPQMRSPKRWGPFFAEILWGWGGVGGRAGGRGLGGDKALFIASRFGIAATGQGSQMKLLFCIHELKSLPETCSYKTTRSLSCRF